MYKELYRGYDPRGFISTSATYGPLNIGDGGELNIIYNNILFSMKKKTEIIVCEFSRSRGDGHACLVKVRHRRSRTLEGNKIYDFSIHFTLFSYTSRV